MPPKLTREEKKLLAARKKAERTEQKRLLLLKQAHDALEREIAFGRKCHHENEKKWRAMLINIAQEKMRMELEFAWQNFERLVDAKDLKLSSLIDYIDSSESQNIRNFASHVHNIDRMLHLYYERVNEFQANFENFLNVLQNENNVVMEQIRDSQQEGEDFLKVMIFGLLCLRRAAENNVKGEFVSKLDDKHNKFLEMLSNKRYGYLAICNEYIADCKRTLESYFKETTEKRLEQEQLKLQDAATAEAIRQDLKKRKSLQERQAQIRDKYYHIKRDKEKIISSINIQAKFYRSNYIELNQILTAAMSFWNTNILMVVTVSAQIIDYLLRLERKGNNVLRLMMAIRKLQTQSEKVLGCPFPFPCEDIPLEPYSDELIADRIRDDLALFWMKVAEADAARQELLEERACLLLANQRLKEQISDYCKCCFCPGNPQTTPRGQKPTVVCAKEMVKNYKKFNY